MRDYKIHLEDILKSIQKIEGYTKSCTYNKFSKNELVIDAVIRNLEIIGRRLNTFLLLSVRKLQIPIGRKLRDYETF